MNFFLTSLFKLLFSILTLLNLLFTVFAQTDCQLCCGGASCSAAFRGSPGQCCGVVGATSYCCPTNARCVRSGNAYACSAMGYSGSGTGNWMWASILFPILLCCCCAAAIFYCSKSAFARRGTFQPTAIPTSGPPPYATQQAYGPTYYNQPPGYSYGGYNSGGGYGAGSLAAAGGAGLLGGMMLENALDHRSGGGYYDGDNTFAADSGPAPGFGGGDFGGGGGDTFAASN